MQGGPGRVPPSDVGAGHKAYPPRWSHLLVPATRRDATRAALTLYAPCRLSARALHRTTWHLTAVLGARAIPGPVVTWDPPMGAATWHVLVERWQQAVGPVDAMGVYQQPQQARRGLAVLLLQGGEPLAFVKLRPDSERLELEYRVLQALAAASTTLFRAPEPLGILEQAGWTCMVTTALPARPHRPVRRPDIEAITLEIERALAPVLPRGPGVPSHWAPMHGDFTPWNLRRAGRGRPVLYDWEDAGWGPPGADITLYAAVSGALGRRSRLTASTEPVTFWQERLCARSSTDVDSGFNQRLDAVLRAMQPR